MKKKQFSFSDNNIEESALSWALYAINFWDSAEILNSFSKSYTPSASSNGWQLTTELEQHMASQVDSARRVYPYLLYHGLELHLKAAIASKYGVLPCGAKNHKLKSLYQKFCDLFRVKKKDEYERMLDWMDDQNFSMNLRYPCPQGNFNQFSNRLNSGKPGVGDANARFMEYEKLFLKLRKECITHFSINSLLISE